MIFEPQAKLLRHGERIEEWVETGKTTPILIEIAPTGYCNATCPWCFFKNRVSDSRINSDDMIKTIEDMAKAGYERMFDDNWNDLHSNSIDRALWIEIAKAMIKSVKFPMGLYKICRDLHFEKQN